MKNFIFLCFLVLFSSSFIGEPCDIGCLQQKAQAALDDFTFIKQFPVEISDKEKTFEISYVLSVNASYRIAVADNETKGHRMIVKLLDRNRKVISSNVITGTRQFAPNIDFTCPATGVYYIDVSVEKNNTGSGLVILGYKKTSELSPAAQLQ